MASTNFSAGTVIQSTWLNAVNTAVYNTLPTLAPLISPTFITPTLGAATATSINKNYFTQPAASCTWTLADGKTLNVSNTLTLSGTDGASLSLGAGANSVSGANTGDQLTFKNFAVSGQSNVVATTTADTLTLVAGTGVTMTTNAGTKAVTVNAPGNSAMVLLGQATVSTAVTAIDFLTLFSSAYDSYVIDVFNAAASSSDILQLRFAVGGVPVSTAVYYSMADGVGVAGGSGATSVPLASTQQTNGPGLGSAGFSLSVLGVNASGASKTCINSGAYLDSSNLYRGVNRVGQIATSSVITGFRLYWSAGSTFTSGTQVQVYGIRNT